jgi:hypothetical protein
MSLCILFSLHAALSGLVKCPPDKSLSILKLAASVIESIIPGLDAEIGAILEEKAAWGVGTGLALSHQHPRGANLVSHNSSAVFRSEEPDLQFSRLPRDSRRSRKLSKPSSVFRSSFPMSMKNGTGRKGPTAAQRAAQSARDKMLAAKSRQAAHARTQKAVPRSQVIGPMQRKGRSSEGLASINTQDVYTLDFGKQAGGKLRKPYTCFLGTVGTTNLPSAGSFFDPGSVAYSTEVDVNMFIGSGAELFFRLFEMFRVVSASLDFISSQASGTLGDMWFVSDVDPANRSVVGTVNTPDQLASHQFSRLHTVWPSLMGIPLQLNHNKWLYTDPNMVAASDIGLAANTNTLNTSIRENSAGAISVAMGSNILNTITSVGELILHVVLEFKNSQRNDLVDLVYNARLQQINSTPFTVTSAQAFSPFSQFLQSVNSSGNANAFEYMYNPAFASGLAGASVGIGGTLNLPVGCYVIFWDLWTSGTVTGASQALNPVTNAGQYSWRHADNQEGTVPTAIEFTTPPAGVVSISSNTFVCYSVYLRISQAAGPAALFSCSPTLTLTGTSLSITAMVGHCVRVNGFENVGLAALFPRGNANGVISMSNLARSRVMALRSVLDLPDARRSVVKALLDVFRVECWSDDSIRKLLEANKWPTTLLYEGMDYSDPDSDQKSESAVVIQTPRPPPIKVPLSLEPVITLQGPKESVNTSWLPTFRNVVAK